ncbi:MAG: glycosyltransferase [Treponema sp.]|nr:glycosyltransferase [Treponema sp.]
MPEISIIVPVYNTEKYIKKCLDSIKQQTFTDFEVILIDDGSTDSSPQILDSFCSTDSRFKVFHNKNQGVTKVRIDGLAKASGEYIVWIDSDDWVEQNHLALLHETITKEHADICVCNFVKDSNTISQIYEEKLDTRPTPLQSLIEAGSCRGCLWTKIAKRALYQNQDIFPPKGINCWEDIIITANLYYYSTKTVHSKQATYHVNDINQNSLTRDCSRIERNEQEQKNVIAYFENTKRFKSLQLSQLKYKIKYYMYVNNHFATQKTLPREYYKLYSDEQNYSYLLQMLLNEQVITPIRFIEVFLILSNQTLMAKPFHYLCAVFRNSITRKFTHS